jgi:hypothetical protein
MAESSMMKRRREAGTKNALFPGLRDEGVCETRFRGTTLLDRFPSTGKEVADPLDA